MASYYQSKKKPRNKIIAMGPATDDKAAMSKLPSAPDARYPSPRTGSPPTRVNTSGNARQGQKYTTRYTKKGAVHTYASGKSVLVKPKKPKTAPTYRYS